MLEFGEAKQIFDVSHIAASKRLQRMLLFRFTQKSGQDICFRCGEQIEDVDDLSIDHKEAWRSAPDPRAAFFDLENIAFSHVRCNVLAGGPASARAKTECPQGHPYDEANTRIRSNGSRVCRACNRNRVREDYRRSKKFAEIVTDA